MGKRRHLAFTISVAVLFGVRTVSASAKDLPCSDLRKATAARLISIFGTPFPNEMAFSHGTGCYSEDEEHNPGVCDWKVAVHEDRNISDHRRLIVVDTDHMTGQGEQGDVLVLACQAGKVTALFHDTFNRGVDVEEASADKLVLKFSRWGPRDHVCCPLCGDERCTCGARTLRTTSSTESIPSRSKRARSAIARRFPLTTLPARARLDLERTIEGGVGPICNCSTPVVAILPPRILDEAQFFSEPRACS